MVDWVSASEGAGPRKVLDDVTAGSVVNFFVCVSFIPLNKIAVLITMQDRHTVES